MWMGTSTRSKVKMSTSLVHFLTARVPTCGKVCEEIRGHAVDPGMVFQDILEADTALSNHGEEHLHYLVIEPVVSSQGEEVMLGDVNVVPAQDDFTDTEHGASDDLVHPLG
eukprot:TRINITY_DN29833_c0_g1_i1.p2 TRINITY_DN29833_c0_g1~~TRINITY_DN29833_c0_g1_i1.p2  ORF type:complete len:111 (+),score=33.45 TRINITY_DN29833_c0_g1_i1:183-515(+)